MKIYNRHTITLYIMFEVGNVKLFEKTMLKSTEQRTLLGKLNYSNFACTITSLPTAFNRSVMVLQL